MVNESYVSEVATLIERVQATLKDARRVPWTGRVLVDEHELSTLLSQLRHALPEEVRHAHFVLSERQRILDEANDEAEQIKAGARQEREHLADTSAITEASRQKAVEIVQQAQDLAKEIHQGSRQYADDVLSSLENQLTELLASVKKDRGELHA